MLTKVEIEIENGKIYVVDFNGTEEEFKQKVQFGAETDFCIDPKGIHIMVKKINVFKFIN